MPQHSCEQRFLFTEIGRVFSRFLEESRKQLTRAKYWVYYGNYRRIFTREREREREEENYVK